MIIERATARIPDNFSTHTNLPALLPSAVHRCTLLFSVASVTSVASVSCCCRSSVRGRESLRLGSAGERNPRRGRGVIISEGKGASSGADAPFLNRAQRRSLSPGGSSFGRRATGTCAASCRALGKLGASRGAV